MSYTKYEYGVIRDEDNAFIQENPENPDWRRYLAWVGDGNEIPPPPLQPIKDKLQNEIDFTVASVYANWTRFETEYNQRRTAAQAYKDAGYTGEPSIWITGFSSVAGMNPNDAADLILSQAAALDTALEQLGVQRMRKYEIAAATTAEEAQTKADQIKSEIERIAATLH